MIVWAGDDVVEDRADFILAVANGISATSSTGVEYRTFGTPLGHRALSKTDLTKFISAWLTQIPYFDLSLFGAVGTKA